jgi:bifunctional ADP-heptose synthase (sugar kinase/adenylyltransferase)
MKSIIKHKRAVAILNNFKKAAVLVIGDLVMDHFVWGRVRRISPEAPVPVVEVTSESFMPPSTASSAAGRTTVTPEDSRLRTNPRSPPR